MSTPTRLAQRIDDVIDAAVDEGRIVGTVVLVRQNGAPTYVRAAGHADRELGVPTSIDTVFRLASLTKALTAASALALVELGRLALDDPITRFLPRFRPRLPDGSAPEIHIRHLLTHTGGFGYPTTHPADPYAAAEISTGTDQPGMSLEENLKRIASVPLCFPPGSAWRYGVATDVLGAVVGAVIGGSLADAIAEHVTRPLAMRDTSFTVQEPDRLAVPYADGRPRAVRMKEPCTVEDVTFSPARVFDGASFQSGGSGMVGTADDFMTFLEAIRSGGGVILDRRTAAAATANQVGNLRDEDDPGWGFGYLSAVLTDPATAQLPLQAGALAWGGVWGTGWLVDPAAGITVVMLSNTAKEGSMGSPYTRAIVGAVYTN